MHLIFILHYELLTFLEQARIRIFFFFKHNRPMRPKQKLMKGHSSHWKCLALGPLADQRGAVGRRKSRRVAIKVVTSDLLL